MKIDINDILNIDELCKKHYEPETYEHCKRVANLIRKNPHRAWCEEDTNYLYSLALCHDLFEDTECTSYEIGQCFRYSYSRFINDLDILTQKNKETYIEYIKRICKCGSKEAYFVKLADMKDHLTQTETLTDKLKKKYYEAIPYLL